MESENDENATQKPKTASITEYEKSLLLQLIEEKKTVIEDKRTGFSSYAQKTAAWDYIVSTFNADGNTVKRTEAQLRKIWDNWKSSTKKKIAQHKKNIRKTGGGAGPSRLPPEVERVSAIIPEQLRTLPNPYDSDATFEISDNPSVTVDEVLNKDGERSAEKDQNIPNAETEPSNDDLEEDQVPPIPKKKTKKDPRSMLVDFEADEHAIRMKNLNIQTQIFQVELQIKKRSLEMLEEEHQKKMKLLEAKEFE